MTLERKTIKYLEILTKNYRILLKNIPGKCNTKLIDKREI